MLKPHELRTVIEYIRTNGSTTMLRMKKDTGLYGTSLTKTLQAHPEMFILTENYQKVELNAEGEHGDDVDAMVALYEKKQQRQQRVVWIIGGGIGAVIIVLVGLMLFASSQSNNNTLSDDITIPVDDSGL